MDIAATSIPCATRRTDSIWFPGRAIPPFWSGTTKSCCPSDRPRNRILGPGRDGKRIEPQGIKGSALTDRQRSLLLEVIAAWVNILPSETASARLAEIKGALPDTYFAWCGPTTNGSAAYYRVQGPTLVIEYAPQGSTSHIHTIIRDPGNDYGERLVRQ